MISMKKKCLVIIDNDNNTPCGKDATVVFKCNVLVEGKISIEYIPTCKAHARHFYEGNI